MYASMFHTSISGTSNVSASETDSSEVQHQTSSNRNDSTESDSMDVDEASEKTESISMDWSRESDIDKSANFTSPSSGHGSQSANKPRKRGRPRGVQVQNHKGKSAKTSTPLSNPDALATSWAPDLQLSNSLLSQNFSEFGSPSESIPVSSSEEPNSQRTNLRRSNRIRSQSVSRTVSSSVIGLPINLQTNKSRGRDRSNTNTTVCGRATASKGKADIDKTMSETYARRGIFKAVLKGCPTFLRRVDAKIRDEIIQSLTGTPTTKWSAERALDLEIYRAWLSYLNSELNNWYGQFSETSGVPSGSPILPGMAARVYSKIERSVVVDVHDLMGHIIVMPHPPGHLGIGQETLGIVGLRNIDSAAVQLWSFSEIKDVV
ncbi:uncharacterized protein MELLADRAFT_101666 [Melampsora larici-populina 98AG31]|uniref:Uncharacterized protein n=1 Tax=Melampsora larici-populina (strain 98AG31 / pathotype 3-4-7) TaxID=747676 RepID=F4R6K7_MELLP|nr:uncharacterized protein MELLADRAFT_101666 [Melampsora larici-populina 98AG31]EGG12447.1 hypothetical protein MELLADRAFT_101666 [Melampsora larici-populina 98AG31]